MNYNLFLNLLFQLLNFNSNTPSPSLLAPSEISEVPSTSLSIGVTVIAKHLLQVMT